MSHSFDISLTSSPTEKRWGENSLSFHQTGATIHLQSQDESANCLTIQKSARTIANMALPEVKLEKDWSLEYQWHFWLGYFSPKAKQSIAYALLPEADEQQLKNRIKVYTWVRNLINQTPELLSPHNLATQTGEFISQLAPEHVSYSITSGEELKAQDYVGLYNVGRGSNREPALLTLDFNPQNESPAKPEVVLVGKGITFDSGGYTLKQNQGMLHMKSDMGGAATVAGALALAICNGLKKPVRLILCCAENLVSGHAYKLSDILKYRNGVSVEVVNTDAEGRLVLADGLIDADQTDAALIIDAATLTGAAVVAVGDDYNALFSMDDALAMQYEQIAKDSLDPCWRLPLNLSHQNNCPSPYADTANSKPVPGGGAGGASNAAGFLSRFLENPQKGWLHVDLAACYCASENKFWAAGATGRGTRSIAAMLNQL